MKKTGFQRVLALVLAICTLIPLFPTFFDVPAVAAGGEKKPVIVIAGGDFQNRQTDHEAGAEAVGVILNQIRKAYPSADGFLSVGDYTYNYKYADSKAGKEAFAGAVSSAYPAMPADRMVWAQGNHDPDRLVTDGVLSSGGAHDAEAYGVYVINEQDYMWYNDDEARIRNTASALDQYLDEKFTAAYSRPIFVVSHLPLHYNMRTMKGGGDGMYANYIFDVLNEAGAKGLNIIFLYGHNHSHGWDDYLGGGSVYLEKGDSIHIAQSSRVNYKTERLNFTYMNPGFVSYYGDTGNGSDQALTMTAFEITEDQVTVSRYDANGTHVLKAAGVYGGEYNDAENAEPGYAVDARVYESGRVIRLNRLLKDGGSDVVVAAPGAAGVWADSDAAGSDGLCTYDIRVTGHEDGDTIRISAPARFAYDTERPVTVIDHADGTVINAVVADDHVLFETDHCGRYSLLQAQADVGETQWGAVKYLENVTSPEANTPYIITSYNYGLVMTGEQATNPKQGRGLLLSGKPSPDTKHLWYYENGRLNYRNSGQYLQMDYQEDGKGDAWIGGIDRGREYCLVNNVFLNTNKSYSRGTLTLQAAYGYDRERGCYVNRRGGSDADLVATAWTQSGNDTVDSCWYFYALREEKVRFNISALTDVSCIDGGPVLIPTVHVGNEAAFDYEVSWSTSDKTVATVDKGYVHPLQAGSVTVTAALTAVNGHDLITPAVITYPITVTVVDMESFAISASQAYVARYSGNEASTGAYLTVTYTDGSSDRVPVTVGMLSTADGEMIDTSEPAVYSNLAVTYRGVKAYVGFSLYVEPGIYDDCPQYPDEGGVFVNKTGTGIDFQSSGIGMIELSAAGIPSKKGAEAVRGDGDLIRNHDTEAEDQDGFTDGGIQSNASAPANTCNVIADESEYAAAEAYFIDVMGEAYDIQMKTARYEHAAENGTETRTVKPLIQVRSYSLYTGEDAEKGLCGENRIGQRKKDANGDDIWILQEEVTFNEAGTAAYSNVRGSSENILTDGVIYADTFWYNTTDKAVAIDLGDGKTHDLEPEAFCWKVGTLSAEEKILCYYVCLSGSMEGDREPGIYETNESATLYYITHPGDPAQQSVASPKFPWKQAAVGCGFYVVNACGEPVVDLETGETGNFDRAVKVTDPAYRSFLLNSGEQTVNAAAQYDLAGLRDRGYSLYDTGAQYRVSAHANGGGYYTIDTGDENGKNTTYVVGAERAPVTGTGTTNTYNYASADTVVWFAVTEFIDTNPDAVVIDYAIPVDIHVLVNDEKMDTGCSVLAAIGAHRADMPEADYTDMLADGFGNRFTGRYGVAEIIDNGSSDTARATIRYTLNTSNGMEMAQPETFTYAVQYTGNHGKQGYYYETVTVIPAANIYYEDSYLTFTDSEAKGSGTDLGKWVTSRSSITVSFENGNGWSEVYAYCRGAPGAEGTWPGVKMADNDRDNIFTATVPAGLLGRTVIFNSGDSGEQTGELVIPASGSVCRGDVWSSYRGDPAIQAEDRPGSAPDALKHIDADNVYGCDPSYKNCRTYSLGSAMMVTVDADTGKYATGMSVTGADGKVDYAQTVCEGEHPKATFSFTGTGFDVVGLTDSRSGGLIVEVRQNGAVVRNRIVNTYYGYKFADGEWIVDKDATDCLYQVPVIKIDDLPYGTYDVTIRAVYLTDMDMDYAAGAANSYTLWLDAIRIYNPAQGNAIAEAAYSRDGEANPCYANVKDLLVTCASGNEETQGVVYLDGKAEDVAVAEYRNRGPDNEAHLTDGYGIAFKLRYRGADAPDINLHIGAKLAKGSGATLICNGNEQAILTTPTNMFYKLPDLKWEKNETAGCWETDAIVLECEAGDGNILSLTDLKITGANAADIRDTAADGTETTLMPVVDHEVVESARKYMGAGNSDSEDDGGGTAGGGNTGEGGNASENDGPEDEPARPTDTAEDEISGPTDTAEDETARPTDTAEDETARPADKVEDGTAKPSGGSNEPAQDGSSATSGNNMMLPVMLTVFILMGVAATVFVRRKEEM